MDETDLTIARAQARVGTLLNGRWHLDKLVGVGGMAAVYAATHRNTKRVAVKILHPEISTDDNARQRFLREGYAANQVGHRGAVAADDDGLTEDGVAFLVMELLEGETIEERSVRHGGTLTGREVLALMDQVLATLEAAHAKGIVHRDLKPENLFLTHEGVVKVLDFGIARVDQAANKSPSQTQGIMGTPSFMAPEQARGRWEDVDARSDLWAIGATMFTLFSGRFVHEAETANEALVAAVTQRARSLGSVALGVHSSIVAVVDKALAYEREARFQSASELREALRAADAAIATDETSPSLRVPLVSPERAPAIAQASPLGLTASGMASSVRSVQTGARTLRGRAKTPLVALSFVALALVGWFGRGLVHSTSVAAATPVAAPALEHAATAAAPPSQAAAAAASQPVLTATSNTRPALGSTPSPTIARPSVARSPKVVTAHAPIPVKAVAAKSAADLLKKRH
jgi:eukaryotic-like serine/threonine-protein kinase